MTTIVLLGIVGLAGIVAGFFALRSIARTSRGVRPSRWLTVRISSVAVGLILGVASWPLTYWMAYSMATPEGPARIVGLPFFVAFFDSAGRDYVSAWTLWGCVGNVLFWFMVPQIAVSIY